MARRLSDDERIDVYGRPGDERRIHWVRTPWTDPRNGKHIVIAVHQLLVEEVLHTMAHAVRPAWTPQRIDSLAVRRIRGGRSWSLHSWGLAWDIFATPPGVPPPGGVWTPRNGLTRAFADEWTAHGFTWGGTWQRRDVPHIEWAGPPP